MDALATPRLRLEPIAVRHAGATAARMTPAVAAMLLNWPSPMSVAQAETRIRGAAARPDERHWAVMLAATDALAGWVSLMPTDRVDRMAIGIWLGEAFWGQGLGGEAIGAVIRHARRTRRAIAFTADVRPGNSRSIAMLAKLGMRPAGRTLIHAVSGATVAHLRYELPPLHPAPRRRSTGLRLTSCAKHYTWDTQSLTSAGGDSGMSTSEVAAELTEHESHVLALIARDQPTTAYKIRKIIEGSPTAGISSSSGAVYPIVNRLKAKGYLTAATIANDGRNTELLLVTKDGRAAIRRWVRALKPSQLLPEDPIRTRIAHSDFLTPAERATWLGKLRAALEDKLVEIAAYGEEYPSGAILHAHEHARMMTNARIAWIDETIARDAVAEPDDAKPDPREMPRRKRS